MESNNTSLPNTSSRDKLLQRSFSVQPESTFQVSSPYSSRRKSRNPGRSLTELFTGKTRTRASSSDTSVSLRRRTITAGAHFQTSAIKENVDNSYMNRSFSELPYSFRSSDYSTCDACDSSGSENHLESGKCHMPLSLPDTDMLTVMQEEEGRLASSTYKSKCTEEIKENNVKSSFSWNVLKIAFKILFWLIVLLLIITLLCVGFATYFAYKKTQCDLKRAMKMPLEELKQQLTLSVIGQEIAVNVILNSLRALEVNKIGSPLILWMVGWTGSGKTHTTGIFKNVFSTVSKVFTVIPSLFPQNDNDQLQKEVSGLYHQLDPCSYNVIVIDGWDEDNLPLQILEHFIINLQNIRHKKNGKGKTIIVLCGTQGSQYVNREYLKLSRGGKKRKNLKINDFQTVTKTLTEVRKLNDITKSFVFVPFIPMEAEQIRMCVIEEFLKLKESSTLAKDFDLEEKVISEVIDQLNFIPSKYPLVADTGCKRVQPLLRRLVLFEDAENTL